MKTIFAFLVLSLVACSSPSEKNIKQENDQSPFVQGGSYSQELSKELTDFQKQEAKEEKERLAKITDVEFLATSFDFGNVKVDSKNVHYFKLKNTGKKPLIVESVKASCGCTTPKKLEKPIAPGATDSIRVEFVPYEGMSGRQEKVVTVKTNTLIPVNQLTFTAVVGE